MGLASTPDCSIPLCKIHIKNPYKAYGILTLMTFILGVDDAGRGPVIGPMVLAGCLIKEENEEKLRKIGVRDSKLLTSKRREHLAKEIKKIAESFAVVLIFPDEIDSRNHIGLNLNKIEAIKAGEIIDILNDNSRRKIKVIVDCPSPNKKSWQRYLMSKVEKKENLRFFCEHKADRDYIPVAAASILAKTTRDAEIHKIKQRLKIDFGSGYPSDPITIKFLTENYHKHKNDGMFRHTWGTIKNHKAKKAQRKLGEF